MVNVFVSRPTWIPKELERGLEGFLGLLIDQKLNPRTVGATDYPTSAPLDEVIAVMAECKGAVILGFPQLVVHSGILKGVRIPSEMSLPTEWNHIEAGLAYAKHLPLLVIHDVSVKRGIFEHGTLNAFVYPKRFEDPGWPLDKEVRGAVQRWKRDVVSGRSNQDEKKGASKLEPESNEITEDQMKVLRMLAELEHQQSLGADEIAIALRVSQQKAIYFIDGLMRARLIGVSQNLYRGPSYYLNPRGREFLATHGLL